MTTAAYRPGSVNYGRWMSPDSLRGDITNPHGVVTAAYSLPALSEGLFDEGAPGLVDFAHAGGFAYFGAFGPLGVGAGIFGKGTYDVANAWNQYAANTIGCAAAVPSHP